MKELGQITEKTRFMVINNIETLDDLLSFKEQTSIKLEELIGKRANLWWKYKRGKTKDYKVKIYNEIEELQPQIKEVYNNRKYCDGIYNRSMEIKNNIDNFDKDINLTKEKDNIRVFKTFLYYLLFI